MWSQAQILGFDTAVLRTTSNFSSFTSRLRRTFTLLYSTFTLLSINIVGLSVKRIRQTKAPGYPLRLYAVQRHETSQRIQKRPNPSSKLLFSVTCNCCGIAKLQFPTPLHFQVLALLSLGLGLMKDIGKLIPIPLPHEPKEAVPSDIPLG